MKDLEREKLKKDVRILLAKCAPDVFAEALDLPIDLSIEVLSYLVGGIMCGFDDEKKEK